MMTLLKLFCMPKHPWNKELSMYTAMQRKTSSTTADIAHVTTAVQSMTSSKSCLFATMRVRHLPWLRVANADRMVAMPYSACAFTIDISLPTSRSTQARAQFFRKESRVPVDIMSGKKMPAVHTSRARPLLVHACSTACRIYSRPPFEVGESACSSSVAVRDGEIFLCTFLNKTNKMTNVQSLLLAVLYLATSLRFPALSAPPPRRHAIYCRRSSQQSAIGYAAGTIHCS